MHIYVHIPFCKRKCPYCGFYSVENGKLASSYISALLREVEAQELVPSASCNEDVHTIYFGGGTPSYVDEEDICRVLEAVRKRFAIDEGEFTIEVNPNSLDENKAQAYARAGFNRISIGVQSLKDDVLKTLGRLHSSEEALRAISIARDAGFVNISCDMILGVPGQREENLYEDASALLQSGAKHISMYSLMVEEGTPFYDRYGEKLYEYVDEDLERAMYHGLRDYLSSKGVKPYEISNCAYPGYESRHNLAYWKGREYYAFGAGAHGYLDSVRFAHEENVEAYINDPFQRITEEVLDEDAKLKERCMLALRTSEGVASRDCIGLMDIINKNLQSGYLKRTDKGFCLTRKGLDFANLVFMDLV